MTPQDPSQDTPQDAPHFCPTSDDFAALHLERGEAAIIEALSAEMDVAALQDLPDAEKIAFWSADEAARREALTLFYQLLKAARSPK